MTADDEYDEIRPAAGVTLADLLGALWSAIEAGDDAKAGVLSFFIARWES